MASSLTHGKFTDCIARLANVGAMVFDVAYFTTPPIGWSNRKGRNNSMTATEGDPGSFYAIARLPRCGFTFAQQTFCTSMRRVEAAEDVRELGEAYSFSRQKNAQATSQTQEMNLGVRSSSRTGLGSGSDDQQFSYMD